jgi:hypothetical protein
VGQTQPLVSATTQQLNQEVSAVASAAGVATFTFQNPPTGLLWSGTLSCSGAPTTAIFLAAIGGTTWGSWAGNSVGGPVQAKSSQQLVVTASGLTAGITYLLVWSGSSDQESTVQPTWPEPNSSALFAATANPGATVAFGPATIASGGTGTITVPVSPQTRTLLIECSDTGAGSVSACEVFGGTTGFEYLSSPNAGSVPYLGAGTTSSPAIFVVSFPAALEGSATIEIITSDAQPVMVTVLQDTLSYKQDIFYTGTAIGASATANASTVTIITGPARLLSVSLVVAGAALGEIILGGNVILAAVGTANSQGTASLSYDDDVILTRGTALTVSTITAVAVIGAVTYAYP